jgi:hypothetical protein
MQDLALAVSSYQDFASFATNNTENYILVNDVDLAGWYIGKAVGAPWVGPSNYAGHFYGNGYTISNLYFGSVVNGDRGLFNTLADGAEISDLVINFKDTGDTASSMTSNTRFGAIVAYVSTSGTNNMKLSNITVNGSLKLNSTASNPYMHLGGLVGELRADGTVNLEIENCVSNLNVELRSYGSTNIYGISYGGIIGMTGNGVSIKNSYTTGKIDVSISSSDARLYVGGLIAYVIKKNATVENCYSTSEITVTKAVSGSGVDFKVGGLVGSIGGQQEDLSGSPYIKNSFALNKSITKKFGTSNVNTDVGRVYGFLKDASKLSAFDNNYALSSITINGAPVTSADAKSVNGKDTASFTNASTWTAAPPAGLGWSTDIWDFTHLSATVYPTLKQSN